MRKRLRNQILDLAASGLPTDAIAERLGPDAGSPDEVRAIVRRYSPEIDERRSHLITSSERPPYLDAKAVLLKRAAVAEAIEARIRQLLASGTLPELKIAAQLIPSWLKVAEGLCLADADEQARVALFGLQPTEERIILERITRRRPEERDSLVSRLISVRERLKQGEDVPLDAVIEDVATPLD